MRIGYRWSGTRLQYLVMIAGRNRMALSGYENEHCSGVPKGPSGLVVHAQSDAAVNGVADRLRAQCAIDEEIGDPAFGDAEAEAAAIFEPALVADCRHHSAIAGHGGDNTGMGRKRLREPAIDVALDAVAEQMGPLPAKLDQIGSIGPGWNGGSERIECNRRIRVAVHPLPHLPHLDGGCDLVARRKPADPARPAIDAVVAAAGLAIQRNCAETGRV